MKLKNILLVVENIEKSVTFYTSINEKITDESGRSFIRISDPDGHAIEVGEQFN